MQSRKAGKRAMLSGMMNRSTRDSDKASQFCFPKEAIAMPLVPVDITFCLKAYSMTETGESAKGSCPFSFQDSRPRVVAIGE